MIEIFTKQKFSNWHACCFTYISGLEAMEQIVKGAGIEKSGPADLEHLLGKVAVKTVPRRNTHEVWMAPPN
jgi:hypothetical protein